MRIGVKFCGNCNPRLDMPELLTALAAEAAAEGVHFVRWDDPGGYEVLLVLNSCQVGCATLPEFTGPHIVVTSESVRNWPVREEDLPAAILDAIRVAQ